MTNKEEVIKHLIMLKESAVKSHNDTGIINVKLDSFNFVMDMAIKALSYDDAKYHEEHGEVIVDKAVWEDAERALEPSDDLIQRQAVLDLLEDTNNGWIINEVLQLPSVKQEPCEDAISRQAVIDAIYDMEILKYRIDLENVIKALPSVKPQEKTGHWIGIDEEPHEVWECDHCGFVIDGSGCIDPYDYRDTYKYCPYCGARMVEEQESEVQDADSN